MNKHTCDQNDGSINNHARWTMTTNLCNALYTSRTTDPMVWGSDHFKYLRPSKAPAARCGGFQAHRHSHAPATSIAWDATDNSIACGKYDVVCSICMCPQKHLRSSVLQTLSGSDNILHRLTPQPDVVTCHFNERLTDCHDGDLSTIWPRPIGQTHETWDPLAERHWVDMTRVNTCCSPCFSFLHIDVQATIATL